MLKISLIGKPVSILKTYALRFVTLYNEFSGTVLFFHCSLASSLEYHLLHWWTSSRPVFCVIFFFVFWHHFFDRFCLWCFFSFRAFAFAFAAAEQSSEGKRVLKFRLEISRRNLRSLFFKAITKVAAANSGVFSSRSVSSSTENMF